MQMQLKLRPTTPNFPCQYRGWKGVPVNAEEKEHLPTFEDPVNERPHGPPWTLVEKLELPQNKNPDKYSTKRIEYKLTDQ